MSAITPEMGATWRTLAAFFSGDPEVTADQVYVMLAPVGSFLGIPHHGSEAVTGVALRCGFAIATNGDVVYIPRNVLIPADQLIDALTDFAASTDLADLPTTPEPEVTP